MRVFNISFKLSDWVYFRTLYANEKWLGSSRNIVKSISNDTPDEIVINMNRLHITLLQFIQNHIARIENRTNSHYMLACSHTERW